MDITFTILMFAPLILILWLANFSERRSKPTGVDAPSEGASPIDAGEGVVSAAKAYPAEATWCGPSWRSYFWPCSMEC